MVARLTTAEFISKARDVHGLRYGYRLAKYTNNKTDIIIVCPKHGEFKQRPGNHLNGSGCQACSIESAEEAKYRLRTEKFVAKAEEIHSCRYSYDSVQYKTANSPVEIICQKHGKFRLAPYRHLNGSGCPDCDGVGGGRKRGNRVTFSEFLQRARKAHGGKFEYIESSYRKLSSPVTVVCRRHGEFSQLAMSHLKGFGCKKCAEEDKGRKRSLSWEQFVSDADKKFGSRFSYVKPENFSLTSVVPIICQTHGEFFQTAYLHRNSTHGCPECAKEHSAECLALTESEFVKRARKLHRDKYTYPNPEYSRSSEKVRVVCPSHGEFSIQANCHLQGQGCVACTSSGPSSKELEIFNYLESLGMSPKGSDRDTIKPLELDIVVPDQRLAIEYNGDYWHSDQRKPRGYHLNKTVAAQKQGIRLIHIFEHRYIRQKDLILRLLAKAAGVGVKSIGARKCRVVTLTYRQSAAFYNSHHLMGAAPGALHLGLEFDGELICAATFSTRAVGSRAARSNELVRFCVPPEISIPGGLSRLCRRAMAVLGWGEMISYVDRAWFNGSSYHRNGWELLGHTQPGYCYVHKHNHKMFGRSLFAKKNLERMARIHGFEFSPEKSEFEMMRSAPFYRVWDCGNLKLRLSNWT